MIRDLFTQQPVSSDIWIALAWFLGILIVAYTLAMATYHRKIVVEGSVSLDSRPVQVDVVTFCV
jgi:hypothetical protein